MTLRLGLILGAGGAFIIFVWFALHWRAEAIRERARADAAVVQEQITAKTSAISDQTTREVRTIIEKGQKEIEYVQTLPGADTPLDPVRRAGICGSLGRVFDGPVCASDQADAEPAGALPDAGQ